jgi:acetyl esterase
MLDEVTNAYLEQVYKARGKPLEQLTPDEARRSREYLLALFGKGPEMASVEEIQHDGFSSRLLVPHGEVKGTIVWLHGGGWVLGSLNESDTLCRRLAQRTGFAVLVVGYRLAPEHRFPAAVDDAYTALEWAAKRGGRLIVGGDSAGGNLSAVISRRARDRNGPKVSQQILVYPVTDANFETESYRAKENQLSLTREGMIWFWNQYAPTDQLHPDASPLRAADLSRLPPAVILTAEHDVLRDDGESYAKALIAAGVPVTFKRFTGQIHTFFVMVNVLPAHVEGLEFVARAIEANS